MLKTTIYLSIPVLLLLSIAFIISFYTPSEVALAQTPQCTDSKVGASETVVSPPVQSARNSANVVVNNASELDSALKSYRSGEIILLKNGTYNLGSKNYTLSSPVKIVGESRKGVVVKNAGTITITSSDVMIGGITFDGFGGTLFPLGAGSKNISNLSFYDSDFTGGSTAIQNNYTMDKNAVLENITVQNSNFYDLYGAKVAGVFLRGGVVKNANIVKNTFNNLWATDKSSMAILVGDNWSRFQTSNINISGNSISNIGTQNLTGKGTIDIEYPAVHGIQVFAEGVRVTGNKVANIHPHKDHEAVYLKANYANVSNNRVHNGGSQGMEGDIIIKSSSKYPNVGNLIENNVITSDNPNNKSWGITAYGEATIRNNTIIKESTAKGGIFSKSLDKDVKISGNTILAGNGIGMRLTAETGASTHTLSNNDVSVENLNTERGFIDTDGGAIVIDSGGNNYCDGPNCRPEFKQNYWAEAFPLCVPDGDTPTNIFLPPPGGSGGSGGASTDTVSLTGSAPSTKISTVNVTKPTSASTANVTITVNDGDRANEGVMWINNRSVRILFGRAADPANDGVTKDFSFSVPASSLYDGANSFIFRHRSGDGYTVEKVEVSF